MKFFNQSQIEIAAVERKTTRFLPDMPDKSENQLARILIEWLDRDGWEVFEEVAPWGNGGRRADVVARRGGVIWVIECKKQFNLELLEQATGWIHYAHFVSLAVWHPNSLTQIIETVCRKFGVGLLLVKPPEIDFQTPYPVIERGHGVFRRRADIKILKSMLIDETRAAGFAGSPARSFETPFKRTRRNLLAAARRAPGITLEEALRSGENGDALHHYKSDRKAKINILNRFDAGELPDIRVERRGKAYLLFPADDNILTELPVLAPAPAPAQGSLFGHA